MSMLAEKKKREKWCLNPRGKSWSEDKNKFGQRLLEKMGWNSGQGLGVNNQGQTEIVKVKMKDDNKGLGFKVNGEEWLKTTNQFNELLDQLGSNEKESDAKPTEMSSSLEDRSKKSKTRVHYHKFTRGKDLSQYSEKDLASIVGPDLVKSRKNDEFDYSLNQVNKGSLTEYFQNKFKQTKDQVSSLEITPDENDTMILSTEEGIHSGMKRRKKISILKEHTHEYTGDKPYNPCVFSSDEMVKNVIEPNICDKANDEQLNSFMDSCNETGSILEVPKKKRKKRSSSKDIVHEISIEESFGNESCSSTKPKLEVVSSKKNESNGFDYKHKEKRKKNKLNIKDEQTAFDAESFAKVQPKKKKKNTNKSDFDGCKSNIDEYVEQDSTKMKIEKTNSRSDDLSQLSHNADIHTNNKVIYRRKNNVDNDLLKMPNYDTELLASQASSKVTKASKKLDDKSLSKKKLKIQASESFQDIMQCDEIKAPKEEEYSGCGTKKCKELLENNNLPKVNASNNLAQREMYETDEHLSDSSLAIHKFNNGNKPKSSKVKTGYENNLGKETHNSEVYINANEHNYKASKGVILYEHSLLKNILKKLNIEEPPEATLKTINSDEFDRAANRKLRLIYRSKQMKVLLPLNEVTEIEKKVNKFSKLVRRRNKMFDTLNEIEKQVSQISTDLAKNSKDSNSLIVKEMDVTKQLDSSILEIIQKVSSQLESLKKKSTALTRQESCTIRTDLVPSKIKDVNDVINSEKTDNQKQVTVKNQQSGAAQSKIKEKLDMLMNQVNQLLMGRMSIRVSGQDTPNKNNPQDFNHLDKTLSSQKTSSNDNFETFQCSRSKIGSAQMLNYQRGKEGFGRRGQGIRSSLSFRGRGSKTSRLSYAEEYDTDGVRDFPCNRRDYIGLCGRELRGQGGRELRGQGRRVLRGHGGRELIGRGGRELIGRSGRGLIGRGGRGLRGYDGRELRGYGGRELIGCGGRELIGRSGRGLIGRGGRGLRGYDGRELRGYGGRELIGCGGRGLIGRGGRGLRGYGGRELRGYGGRELRGCGGRELRGRGGRELRGRGGRELRARGRISQNNFDAKQYAEKCKAENKVPELGFKGVDLKVIFGYAASKEDS